MESKNLSGILDKINELRALFIFGQRVIPFLEELFYFVNDIVPVLEEMNLSIYESTRRMPKASSQLKQVTEETEVATTEILDSLDGVLSKLDGIDAHFDTALSDLNNIENLDDKIYDLMRSGLGANNTAVLTEINALRERKRSHLSALRSNASGLDESLKEIRRSSNDIMISLQVQDITAQQIASVNHLIQSIQERLSSLIDRFKISGAELIEEIERPGETTFDPFAVYDRSGKRQRTADEVIRNEGSGSVTRASQTEVPTDPAAQDEIDRLFRKGNGT